MPEYLITLSISPVQSFIQEARKARDLFAGSALLSELAGEAMAVIGIPNIILPQLKTGSNTNPNQFTAKLDLPSSQDLQALANNAEKAVRDRLTSITHDACKDAKLKDPATKVEIEQQVQRYFSVYWAAVEFKKSADYLSLFEELQEKHHAVKGFRPFNQHIELGRKCSVNGSDNALVVMQTSTGNWPGFSYPQQLKNKGAQNYLSNPEALRPPNMNPQINMVAGEGLSGPVFIKRFYGGNQPFNSTADIASLDVVNQVKAEEVYQDYKAIFANYDFDHQLIYRENLTAPYFEKHGLLGIISPNSELLPQVENANLPRLARKNLEKDIRKEIARKLPTDILEPYEQLVRRFKTVTNKGLSSYYAVLLFDGDNMGDWLKANLDLLKTTPSDVLQYQKDLSAFYSEFTSEVKKLVDGNFGQTVYAGGDDYLGLLNLSGIFKTLEAVKSTFSTLLQHHQILQKYSIQPDVTPSISGGLMIAHYKYPLTEVLKQVREAEKKAKAVGLCGGFPESQKKNALTIRAMRHSGDYEEATFRWKDVQVLQDLSQVIKQLNENFSTQFIRGISKTFWMFRDEKSIPKDVDVWEMLQTELKRLVARSHQNGGDTAKSVMNTALQGILDNSSSVHEFLSLLSIIEFLTRKTNQ